MHFAKMHALGNDFMVIDGVTQKIYLNPKVIQALADRHFGIGFDQLLLVEPPYDPDLDFHYRIFNADGSEVGQCGNGARCFAMFVTIQELTKKTAINVTTNTGRMVLEVKGNNQVKVNMGSPIWEPRRIPFTASNQSLTYLLMTSMGAQMCTVVSMGNPHCVVLVDDVMQAPVRELGPLLETHERFPEKTNVPFMQVISPTEVRVRVWERGCGETNACGSGCCAAVAAGVAQGLLSKDQPVTVHTLGGDLFIEWDGTSNPLYMTGPATYVYNGHLNANMIKNMVAAYTNMQKQTELLSSRKAVETEQ